MLPAAKWTVPMGALVEEYNASRARMCSGFYVCCQRRTAVLVGALRMDVIRRPRPADAAVIARRATLATMNAA